MNLKETTVNGLSEENLGAKETCVTENLRKRNEIKNKKNDEQYFCKSV